MYHSPDTRERAKKLLQGIVASHASAYSLAAIAGELGVSRGYLRYWQPLLVDKLVAKRRSAAKRRTELRLARKKEIIRAAIGEATAAAVDALREPCEKFPRF